MVFQTLAGSGQELVIPSSCMLLACWDCGAGGLNRAVCLPKANIIGVGGCGWSTTHSCPAALLYLAAAAPFTRGKLPGAQCEQQWAGSRPHQLVGVVLGIPNTHRLCAPTLPTQPIAT
jgi:hypothetical protein